MDNQLENDYSALHEKLKSSGPKERLSFYDDEVERLELKLREFKLGYDRAKLDGAGEEAEAEIYLEELALFIDKLRYERRLVESDEPVPPPSIAAAPPSNPEPTPVKPLFSTAKPLNRKRLTVPQAADYLGIATQTVYEWCSEKKIPHKKIGRKTFFDTDELDAWIAKHKVKPIGEAVKARMADASGRKTDESEKPS